LQLKLPPEGFFYKLNLHISGSKKQSDEERGAPLFDVSWMCLCTPAWA